MADEVAVAGLTQHVQRRCVHRFAGRAGDEGAHGGVIAGPGCFETAPLVRRGLADDVSATAFGVVATHFDADADDHRVTGFEGDGAGLSMWQGGARAGVDCQCDRAAVEVDQIVKFGAHLSRGFRLHGAYHVQFGDAAAQAVGDGGAGNDLAVVGVFGGGADQRDLGFVLHVAQATDAAVHGQGGFHVLHLEEGAMADAVNGQAIHADLLCHPHFGGHATGEFPVGFDTAGPVLFGILLFEEGHKEHRLTVHRDVESLRAFVGNVEKAGGPGEIGRAEDQDAVQFLRRQMTANLFLASGVGGGSKTDLAKWLS